MDTPAPRHYDEDGRAARARSDIVTANAPWEFLIVTVIGAALTLNAYRPLARSARLSVVSFFAGWLVSELPVHHLVWQLLATAAFVYLGALRAWPGWLGMGITAVSWVALGYLVLEAHRARGLVEASLSAGLGEGFGERIARSLLGEGAAHFTLLRLARPFAPHHPRVERIRNVAYAPEQGRRGMLDIYRSRAAPHNAPVLIQVHGGAWVIGAKEQQGLPLMNLLASRGWVCVAINYRLSPRATFPDHIVDVKRAIAWVKEHIAEYGGDPEFVAITGGSAGGHLSSLAALTPGVREFQPGFEDKDTRVAACVSFYGVYDFTNRTGAAHGGLSDILQRLVMKKPLADARQAYEQASPMSRVNAGAPPFMVIHGANDSLVPVAEARHFVQLLKQASREPVAYAEMPGAQHAFEVFTSVRSAHVLIGVGRFLAWVYSRHLAQRADEHLGRERV
jgi:acetyl esterase/lipase